MALKAVLLEDSRPMSVLKRYQIFKEGTAQDMEGNAVKIRVNDGVFSLQDLQSQLARAEQQVADIQAKIDTINALPVEQVEE